MSRSIANDRKIIKYTKESKRDKCYFCSTRQAVKYLVKLSENDRNVFSIAKKNVYCCEKCARNFIFKGVKNHDPYFHKSNKKFGGKLNV